MLTGSSHAPSETTPRARASIDNIQTLRAVAALLVVFVHLDVFLRALGVTPFGHGGVDLFFVISGFIMVHTTRARPVTAVEFMVNRITRIAPIYWLITLAVYAVALIAPSLLQATSSDPWQLLQSLAFIPFQKSNGLIQPVLFVGWTLNYEMFFYALFAVGLLFPTRAVGGVVVAVVIGLFALYGQVASPHSVPAAFYTRDIVLEFAAGMGLAALVPRIRGGAFVPKAALLAVCVLGLAAMAFLPLVFTEQSRLFTQGLPSLAVVAAAVVLHQQGLTVSSPLLLLLGNASYSIYLTHPFVTQAAQKAGKLLGLTPVVTVLLIVMTLLAVCVVGVGTHLVIERPLTRFAKGVADRLLALRRGRAPAHAT
jgi:exopolysaccharide production protein ExoZ